MGTTGQYYIIIRAHDCMPLQELSLIADGFQSLITGYLGLYSANK